VGERTRRRSFPARIWKETYEKAPEAKEKAFTAAVRGKATVLGRHWRTHHAVMRLVVKVSWGKRCKGAR